jgi:molybdenum cofactor guanylyltransferase
MGSPKAALEWHGSTLLRRTVGVIARVVDGPVVVVRAPGQELPLLPGGVEVVEDPRQGKGPVQGIAAGLAALAGRAEVAFVSATDLPFLHPAFVRRVLAAVRDGIDVGLPVARGYPQPLAAAYRVTLAAVAERLVEQERLRPAFLFGECVVERMDEEALLSDPVLAAFDPELASLLNVNEPGDYAVARERPAPQVTVQRLGPPVDGQPGPEPVRAATVAEAAAAAGLVMAGQVVAALNGDQVTRDGEIPLVAGDVVFFLSAGLGG